MALEAGPSRSKIGAEKWKRREVSRTRTRNIASGWLVPAVLFTEPRLLVNSPTRLPPHDSPLPLRQNERPGPTLVVCYNLQHYSHHHHLQAALQSCTNRTILSFPLIGQSSRLCRPVALARSSLTEFWARLALQILCLACTA